MRLLSALIIISINCLIVDSIKAQKKPIQLVNTFVGTGSGGNTYPGAQSPFGMISVSPNNTFADYDDAYSRSGYKYSQTEINGFGLTHFNGVGCHAMQDLPFLPVVGSLKESPVRNRNAYKSSFSHEDEKASPGYYQVKLKDYDVDVKFTTTTRSTISKIDFPDGNEASIVFMPTHGANGISAGLISIDTIHNRVTGYATTGGFCWRNPADRPYTVYYVAEFDKPIANYGTWRGDDKQRITTVSGTDIAGFVSFAPASHTVHMKISISHVSIYNALLNLQYEIPSWSFDDIYQQSQSAWSSYLNKIVVSGGTEDEQSLFYTSIYHNLLQANIFNDVNGEYIGFDDKVHVIERGRNKYVNFSLWDTYRTTAYLQAILAPKAASDMIHSLLLDAQQGGAFPNWSMNNQEYGVMNGYSAFPFIANMYAMGATDFDLQAVKDMMKKVSMAYYPNRGQHGWVNIEDYKKYGYVPVDKHGYGTSMTEEYGIDDYSIAKICEAANDNEAATYYYKRSQNVFNLFNPKTGFIQGRNSDGNFITPFVKTTETGFNEGNATQYFWSIPHSMTKFINIAGGKAVVERKLDQFMSKVETGWAPDKPYFWVGNEPCFGAMYVYNFLQRPDKTQYHVRHVINDYFKNTPDGMPGDDDAGTMSALYVFASIGLYPYLPGTAGFTINGPLFEKITFNLDNGNETTIRVKGAASEAPFVKSFSINGKKSSSLWLDWSVISAGCSLDFEMSTSAKKWGFGKKDVPATY